MGKKKSRSLIELKAEAYDEAIKLEKMSAELNNRRLLLQKLRQQIEGKKL